MRQVLEPCISCGEDTSMASPHYSDRLVDASEGQPRYLCALCAQQVRGGRVVHEMTDEQRRNLENAAFAFGSFTPGGH